MTPENWPEPVAYGRPDFCGGLCDVVLPAGYESESPIYKDHFSDVLYTATQVREIVRMEVEAASKLVKHMLKEMADAVGVMDMHLDDYFEAMRTARDWLKENKDAD